MALILIALAIITKGQIISDAILITDWSQQELGQKLFFVDEKVSSIGPEPNCYCGA